MSLRTTLFTVLVIPGLIGSAWATDAAVSAPQITSRIDEAQRVTLYGSTPLKRGPNTTSGGCRTACPFEVCNWPCAAPPHKSAWSKH
jgi:hypothetical protein